MPAQNLSILSNYSALLSVVAHSTGEVLNLRHHHKPSLDVEDVSLRSLCFCYYLDKALSQNPHITYLFVCGFATNKSLQWCGQLSYIPSILSKSTHFFSSKVTYYHSHIHTPTADTTTQGDGQLVTSS